LKLTPQTAERLARGRELFNSGLYFEAHEAWEDVWRVEAGPVRLILHGLIQVAAGLHKATRRNQPGWLRSAASSRARQAAGRPGGLLRPRDRGEFRAALVEALERARRWQAGHPGLDGQAIARLKLAARGPEGTE
jgi:uncharacterized protein